MVGINASIRGVHNRRVLQHNRITLPQPLVNELKLKYGDKLAMHHVNGTIVIKPLAAQVVVKTPVVKKTHKKACGTNVKAVKALDKRITKLKESQKKRRKSLIQALGI